jgi:RNA polymerase sigma-70 factor (ECF subfamily)
MRGPAASFTLLAERRRPEILAYLVRMLGNRDDAEDACQETFLRAHAAFGRLDAGSNTRAWLYRIATNTALNLARGRARRSSRLAETDPDTLTGAAGIGAEERADLRAVGRAVAALPPRQRAALMLRCFQGLDYAEIAASVGGTGDAARANVYQAMRKLRAALGRGLPA